MHVILDESRQRLTAGSIVIVLVLEIRLHRSFILADRRRYNTELNENKTEPLKLSKMKYHYTSQHQSTIGHIHAVIGSAFSEV